MQPPLWRGALNICRAEDNLFSAFAACGTTLLYRTILRKFRDPSRRIRRVAFRHGEAAAAAPPKLYGC